jgi:hypothetical protein
MISHLLNRTLEVWRPATVDDGAGGQQTTRYQAGHEPARLSQPSAAERTAAQQAGATLTQVIYFAAGADVMRGDELRADGEVYRVLATVVPSEPAYLRADCERTQAEGG